LATNVKQAVKFPCDKEYFFVQSHRTAVAITFGAEKIHV
jgi:hypothetical protein